VTTEAAPSGLDSDRDAEKLLMNSSACLEEEVIEVEVVIEVDVEEGGTLNCADIFAEDFSASNLMSNKDR
jgi:hypothetical protein